MFSGSQVTCTGLSLQLRPVPQPDQSSWRLSVQTRERRWCPGEVGGDSTCHINGWIIFRKIPHDVMGELCWLSWKTWRSFASQVTQWWIIKLGLGLACQLNFKWIKWDLRALLDVNNSNVWLINFTVFRKLATMGTPIVEVCIDESSLSSCWIKEEKDDLIRFNV